MVLYGETSSFDTLGGGFGNSSIRKTVRDEGGFTVSSSRAPVKDEGGFTSSSSRAPMKIDSIASAQSIAHGLKRCVQLVRKVINVYFSKSLICIKINFLIFFSPIS